MVTQTIDQYISQYDKEVRERLEQVHAVIKQLIPHADESMSYQIPTFKIDGKNAVHFGASKNHIGLYPSPEAITHFSDKLKNYKVSKGTIQFQNDEILPLELIKEIVQYRIETMAADTFPMR